MSESLLKCVYQGCQDSALYIYNGYSLCKDHCNPISYMEIHLNLVSCPIDGSTKTVGYYLTKVGFDSAMEIQRELSDKETSNKD